MSWLRKYGYSDCVFCGIVAHHPGEPASFVYEDEEVAVFRNVLDWIPVMLLAVPRRAIAGDGYCRHYLQDELWRHMGSLGAVAIATGRTHCRVDGVAQFRLVSNFGSQAMQSQSHAHLHILGAAFQPSFPDLRTPERLIYEDGRLLAYRGTLPAATGGDSITAIMVVPRGSLVQDDFFARMDEYGSTILEIARRELGKSFRLLAEVGPHAPIANNGAHLFILGGGFLGHYV